MLELRWVWSDAWVLWSIAAGSTELTSLQQLISAADYLNHAVPTYAELAGALGRLVAAGCVERTGRGYRASTTIREVLAAVQTPRSSGLAEVDALFAHLETLEAVGAMDKALSRSAYRRAVDEYTGGRRASESE